ESVIRGFFPSYTEEQRNFLMNDQNQSLKDLINRYDFDPECRFDRDNFDETQDSRQNQPVGLEAHAQDKQSAASASDTEI
ncbi:MAG: hypothetical protein K2P90_02985, partial [Holosporales bacterium]|nr:hypothetical protein [Holosporales bacterium]